MGDTREDGLNFRPSSFLLNPKSIGWNQERGPAMPKHKHEHHQRTPQLEISDVRAPYWRRAHRDWRFIAVVLLMLVAITIYVMTQDLSWRPRNHTLPYLVIGGK